MREHVRAHKDPPLDLRAKAFGAALLVHVDEILVIGSAMTISHAVETG